MRRHSAGFKPGVKESAAPKRPGKSEPPAPGAPGDVGLLLANLADLGNSIKRIEETMHELHEQVFKRHVAEKESYTTAEVAKLLGKRPFTVREWCRLGRVNATKTHAGRGVDDEWRISAAELRRVQNDGLLPLPKRGRARW